MSKKLIDETYNQIEKSLRGEVLSVPIGLEAISNAIGGLRKYQYILVGGNPGTGKTALVDYAFVIKVFEWLKANDFPIKVSWKYCSWERSRVLKLAKFMCYKLYNVHRELTSTSELMGWKTNNELLNKRDLLYSLREYFEELLEYVEIFDKPLNPYGFRKLVDNAYKNKGVIEEISEYEKKFIPDDPKEMIIFIKDHIGKTKREKDAYSKKERIDKISEHNAETRDFYGATHIDISQYNRSLSETDRFNSKALIPTLEDFKDSSNPCEDADLVLGLFNPEKFQVTDFQGYKMNMFRDPNNGQSSRFRGITIIKNSYGVDNITKGTMFYGEIGSFMELPSPNNITNDDIILNLPRNVR